MRCPSCKHHDSNVIDSRVRKTGRVRRRECPECKYRFSTTEIIGVRDTSLPLIAPMVIKKNGKMEAFDRKKIYNSIVLSMHKSRRDLPAIEAFASEIEQEAALIEENIPSAELGKMVLEWLKTQDPIAYLRYASIHEELNSLQDFADLIKRLNDHDEKS